jgi:hypothetical protein
MIVGLRLFISSMSFAIVIALAYWFVAHEIAGTFLLGFMAFALAVIAGYMIVAEREADLWGDLPDANQRDGAGQIVGTYSIRSPLPVWAALALTCLLLGVVLSPALALLGIVALLAAGALFIVQSR